MTPPSSPAPRAPLDGFEFERVKWLEMELDDMRQRAEWAEQSAHARWQQLERQAEQIEALELSRDEWKALAIKYGSMTEVEKRNGDDVLYARLALSREVVMLGKADAIAYACSDLARKLRAAVAPPRAPLEGE